MNLLARYNLPLHADIEKVFKICYVILIVLWICFCSILRAPPPVAFARGRGSSKGPRPGGKHPSRVGAQAAVEPEQGGSQEPTGLAPEPVEFLIFFVSGACPSLASGGASLTQKSEKKKKLCRESVTVGKPRGFPRSTRSKPL